MDSTQNRFRADSAHTFHLDNTANIQKRQPPFCLIYTILLTLPHSSSKNREKPSIPYASLPRQSCPLIKEQPGNTQFKGNTRVSCRNTRVCIHYNISILRVVLLPVFLWGHTGAFLKLPQEGVAAGDAHQRSDITDLHIRLFQQLLCLINAERLYTVA